MRSIFLLLLTGILFGATVHAQDQQVVRMARLQIDPSQLTTYKAMLKEQMETAVRDEPGVLKYFAVADKENPARITIMEVYASKDAYKAHLETPHFKKYKTGTKDMVKGLELIDVDPIAFISKEANRR